MQAGKGVIASQDALVDLFARIESVFKRLEQYTEEEPMNEMRGLMRYFLVRIMIELHGIFVFVMNEIKQGRASELMKSYPILLLIEIQRG